MGLDVCLYRYTKHDERVTAEREREERSEALWAATGKKYGDLTEAEKDAVRAQVKADEEAKPLPGSAEKIEADSDKYPEHYYKVGYLRSSYNDGGINRILRNMLGKGKDLGYIFAATGDEYYVKPDWAASLERARALLAEFNQHIEKHGFFRVKTQQHNSFIDPGTLPQTEADALKVFAAVKANSKGSFGSRDGDFFLDEPFQVRALIPGVTTILGKALCTYVIYEGQHEWYRQALEITVEMCEWVLAQPADPAVEYVLHWSG